MYPYRRRGLPWLRITLIGLIVVVVLFAAFLFSLPRVEASAPQGSHISARAPVSLTFTTEMDQAAVEGRLHINPAITGDFHWQDRTLRFVPNVDWPTGSVQVTLDPGAAARNGLPMAFGSSW